MRDDLLELIVSLGAATLALLIIAGLVEGFLAFRGWLLSYTSPDQKGSPDGQ